MKHLRLLIIYTLILAMPISTWANTMAVPHCKAPDNSPHSMHTKMSADETVYEHLHSQHAQVTIQEPSAHSECGCGCDGDELNCSISGCSAVALTHTIEMISFNAAQFVQQGVETLAFPPDPHLLLRPPIILS